MRYRDVEGNVCARGIGLGGIEVEMGALAGQLLLLISELRMTCCICTPPCFEACADEWHESL